MAVSGVCEKSTSGWHFVLIALVLTLAPLTARGRKRRILSHLVRLQIRYVPR
jgi:hypothetical protein